MRVVRSIGSEAPTSSVASSLRRISEFALVMMVMRQPCLPGWRLSLLRRRALLSLG